MEVSPARRNCSPTILQGTPPTSRKGGRLFDCNGAQEVEASVWMRMLFYHGIIPSHPNVDPLRFLISEIRASLPAPPEHGRLLSLLEYRLALLFRQNHYAEP
jgi:hypothetical protein